MSVNLYNSTTQQLARVAGKGSRGDAGRGVESLDINASNHLIVTYDDDTTHDAGEIDVSVPIDDATPASDKVYSSEKVEELLDPMSQLDDLRTDRRLVWHDEFDTFDTSKWFCSTYIPGQWIDNTNPGTLSFGDSTVTTGLVNVGTQAEPSWIQGRIFTRETFRNCLIEVKSKGPNSFWAETFECASDSSVTPAVASGTEHSHWIEFDVAEYYPDEHGVLSTWYNMHVGTDGAVGRYDGHAKISTVDDDWHIYGLDLIDDRHFRFYKDRVLVREFELPANGEVTINGVTEKLVFGHTALKTTGLHIILEATLNPEGQQLHTEDWQNRVIYDWVRVYANENDSNYVDRANHAVFLNSLGTPCIGYSPDILVSDPVSHEDVLKCYLKFLPENTYICPEIKSINVEYVDQSKLINGNYLNNPPLNNYGLGPLEQWASAELHVIVETSIGIFKAKTVNENVVSASRKIATPIFLLTLDPSSPVMQAFDSQFNDSLLNPPTNYFLTVRDMATDDPYYLLVYEGKLYGFSQSELPRAQQQNS